MRQGKPLHCALRRGRYQAIRVPVQAARYTGGPDLRQPDDLIRQRTCGFLAVSCQKDCFSAALFPEKILRLPAGLSVETGKGFIQKKQLIVREQCPCESNPALHSAAQRADGTAEKSLQPKGGQRRFERPVLRAGGGQPQIGADAEVFTEPVFLKYGAFFSFRKAGEKPRNRATAAPS